MVVLLAVFLKRFGLLATSVHFYYLACSGRADSLEVCCHILICGICYRSGQNISLEQIVIAVERLQHYLFAWQAPAGFYIVVYLVVQATFQFGTHSCQFLRVERYILEACRVGAHADKVLYPCGAAQFAAARSCPADASCLLAGTYLLHLDTHVESFGQYLDELPEVDTFVGDIVEYCLVAVALVFHVAYLHLQAEVFGYLPAFYHGLVFAAFCFAILFHIYRACQPVHAFYVVCRPQIGLFQLHFYQTARERHHSDVVSGICFHGHNVTLFQRQIVHIVEISLACLFELYFDKVCCVSVSRNVGQPIVCVQLLVLPSHSLLAEAPGTVVAYFEILVVHIKKNEESPGCSVPVTGVGYEEFLLFFNCLYFEYIYIVSLFCFFIDCCRSASAVLSSVVPCRRRQSCRWHSVRCRVWPCLRVRLSV